MTRGSICADGEADAVAGGSGLVPHFTTSGPEPAASRADVARQAASSHATNTQALS